MIAPFAGEIWAEHYKARERRRTRCPTQALRDRALLVGLRWTLAIALSAWLICSAT